MGRTDDLFGVLQIMAKEWSWKISSGEFITVSYPKRRIKVNKNFLTEDMVEILSSVMMGIYDPSTRPSPSKRCPNSDPNISFEYSLTNIKGPEYWSNSCHLDSILAFIAFTPYPSYRRLILGSSSENTKLVKEIFNSEGKCFIVRKKLFGEGHRKTESVGHTYNLLTDLFFKLKIPIIIKNQTLFYSSIPVEDVLSGDIKISDINHRVLVLENNLGYSSPFDFRIERDRPPKKAILGEVMGNYQLVGIIYHNGVEVSSDVYSTKKLGTHYYLVFNGMDGQKYVYDDLDPKVRLDEFKSKDPSKRGKDVGMMYFYIRTTTPKPQKIIAEDETTVLFSPKYFDVAKDLIATTETIKFSKLRGKAVFENLANRRDFEEILRSS